MVEKCVKVWGFKCKKYYFQKRHYLINFCIIFVLYLIIIPVKQVKLFKLSLFSVKCLKHQNHWFYWYYFIKSPFDFGCFKKRSCCKVGKCDNGCNQKIYGIFVHSCSSRWFLFRHIFWLIIAWNKFIL